MALLDMIHSVRERIDKDGKLVKNTTITRLINDAGTEILQGFDWPFDVRSDGMLFFPARQTGTQGTFGTGQIWDNTTTALLVFAGDDGVGAVFDDSDAIDLAGFRMSDPIRARIVPTGSSFATTGWIITNVAYSATQLTLTLASNLHVTPVATAAWTVYGNEVVLPANVRRIVSAHNEEGDIPVEYLDGELDFDSVIPRAAAQFSDTPLVLYAGGAITSTARTGTWPALAAAAAVTRQGALVWPIPLNDLRIHYSYRIKHTALAVASDVWTNVPDDVIHLIEARAVQLAYDTEIADDSGKATRAEAQVDKRLGRALKNHNVGNIA